MSPPERATVPMASAPVAAPAQTLPGIDAHPHARALLLPVLPRDGEDPVREPAHAYLFHGPPGAGKRTVARAFAAALLADGARTPSAVAGRVERDAHPDLTWVTPSGAGEMLVADIDQAVVAAAAHTPFESRRRVFVLEDAHTMNDQSANRLLKTLEEPPPFAHLVLLAPSPREVLPTVASRCQLVRFDPLPPARIEQRLAAARERGAPGLESAYSDAPAALAEVATGPPDAIAGLAEEAAGPRGSEPGVEAEVEGQTLAACARLALGDARLAGRLASAWGCALREHAEAFVGGALRGDTVDAASTRMDKLLEVAKKAGAQGGATLAARVAVELEMVPAKERKRHEREAADAQRRAERRARTGALDLALRLAQLWLRDVWCVAEGAGELVYAVDRRLELERAAVGCPPGRLRAGVELVQDTRLRLSLNTSEELALEALAYRLQAVLATG